MQSYQKIKRRPFSRTYLKLSHTGKCPSDYAMHQRHFKDIWWAFFSKYVEKIIEIFMDDFSVYGDSFDNCLNNLKLILFTYIETNLVLNWKICHFMVEHGIILGHVVSSKGIEIKPDKIDIISALPYSTSVR